MTNQASEDELIYGVDLGIPGGDFTALSIKKGSTLFTFTGGEAVAIIDLIRTEKLKLLDRLGSAVRDVQNLTAEEKTNQLAGLRIKTDVLAAIYNERDKLEAEL